MRFDASSLTLGKAALFLMICSSSGTAQEVRDPCGANADARPVVLYDAITRTAKIVTLGYAKGLLQNPNPKGVLPFPPPSASELRFLCDGRPAEVWVLNRRLKQVFSVTTTAVFALPSGLPELRGLPSAPAAAPPTAAPTPSAKGGLAPGTMLTTDMVVEYLLNEETFDKPLQQLRDHAATVVEMHSFLNGLFDQYDATLHALTGPAPVFTPAWPPRPEVHAPSTLADTAISFRNVTARVWSLFPDTGRTNLAPAESDFDQLNAEISQVMADVQRINDKLRSYPVVDVLAILRSQVDTYEDSLRVLDHEYQNVNAAITILLALREVALANPPDRPDYLRERNAAEIRSLLTLKYGGTGQPLDAATIARIADLYTKSKMYTSGTGSTDLISRLKTLQQDVYHFSADARRELELPCAAPSPTCKPADCEPPAIKIPPCPQNPDALCVNIQAFPDFRTANPFQGRLDRSAAYLRILGVMIVDLNAAEAETLTAINWVYDNYRASPVTLSVDLQGNSGNLIVYYSIRGTEQFQRYQIASEIQQPQSACVQALAAGTGPAAGTPNCPTTASASAAAPAAASSAPGAATSTPAAATTAAATPPANPPADFYGSFEVHHFVRGALAMGFAYDSISSRSYSWVACPSSSNAQGTCTTTASTGTTYQLVQSNSPQAAVVVGVNLFIKREDMFPGEKPPWWQSYLPTEPFLGASVYPLNHYFVGGSLEPIHGFFLTLGPVFGSQTSLPKNYQYAPGQQVTETSPPTIPSSSRFRKGAFIMAGFDTSLFKAIFGSLWSNVTSVGAPPSTSTTSK